MPELPEVETVRRGLEKELVGRKIETVVVTGSRTVRRQDPEELVSRVAGCRLTVVGRHGKFLLLGLDTCDVVVLHLGMSGQVLLTDPAEPEIKHTHLVFGLEGGPDLRFVDPRTFGQAFVSAPAPCPNGETVGPRLMVPELAHLGFDPIVDGIGWKELAARLAARRTKLKPLLMDQGFVAGIGNIYADEILFAARLRHDRAADSLTPEEVRRLHRSMMETLQLAIEHRGSSLADRQYRDVLGEEGDFQNLHNAYDREGKPCSRCGTAIVRQRANGRSGYFCPSCQQ